MKRLNLNTTHLMLYRTALLLLFALLLICPTMAVAGTIGSNIPISNIGYDQQNPHTIYLNDPYDPDHGLWFVTWEDWRNYSTRGADIYGQFIDSTGTKCGSEIVIANGYRTDIGSATGTNTFIGTLRDRPVTKKSLSIVSGVYSCQDLYGYGYLSNGCTGSINYTTGAVNINWGASGPAFGTPVYMRYTSNTNQTVPRASYRIEDGKIVIVWQDTRANYVYYNTLTNINFASCANPMASVGTETSLGINYFNEYSSSTPTPISAEGIGTGDGINANFAKVLAHDSLIPGTIYFTAGTVTEPDDGFGGCSLSTSGHTCQIDYNSGFVSITFATAPANSVSVTVDYDYYPTFPPSLAISYTSYPLGRQLPKITYDQTGDQFWIVWNEIRSEPHRISELCFANKGYISDWLFDDSYNIGYVRLNGETLAEKNSLLGIPGTDTIRNAPNYSVRLISSSKAPLIETYTYESFINSGFADIACDNTSTICYMVFKGQRQENVLECKCNDKNGNGACDLADVVTDTFTPTTVDDNGIFGIQSPNVHLKVISSDKLNESKSETQYPSVGFDPITKKFLTAWEDMRDGANTKIYGRLVQSGGGLYNSDFIISFQDTNNDDQQDTNVAKSRQTKPFVSYDPVNQRFFVVWQDGRNSTLSLENLDIYGQKVDAEGSLRGNNYALFTLAYNQYNPTIAYNDITSEFLTVWKDARNLRYRSCSATRGVGTGSSPCGSDVYGQRFELGNPSLTLLKMDNTALTPPLLTNFGGGSVDVGSYAIQSFKIRNTGDETLKVDCINDNLACNDSEQIGIGDGINQTFASTLIYKPLVARTIIVTDGRQTCEDNGSGSFTITAACPAIGPPPPPACGCAGGSINYISGVLSVTFNAAPSNGTAINLRTLPPFSFDGIPSQLTTCNDGQTIDLVPASELTFTVRFVPAFGGSFNRCFVIESDGGSPQVNLSAFSKEADIAITYPDGTLVTPPPPPPIPLYDFLPVNIGNTLDKTFIVRNAGIAPLSISSIDSPLSPFSIQSDTCTGTVAPGATCNIVVRFQPTAVGLIGSQFSIHSNDPDTPILTIPIQGTGQGASHMTVSPTSINFGNVQAGQTSDRVITITSDGTLPLTINTISSPGGPFSILGSSTCVPSVPMPGPPPPPGSTCQITVQFAPTTTGGVSSSITIAPVLPATPVTVSLSGTGVVTPDISVLPTMLVFPTTFVGSSSSLSVQVRNIGTAALNITGITNPTAPFSITGNDCPATLLAPVPPALPVPCTITITFTPTSGGIQSSSFAISSNDPDTPSVPVNLSGTGSVVPNILVSPSPLDFGGRMTGTTNTLNITVTNTGTAPLAISSVTGPAAPFSITANTCSGAPLNPAASCQITIRFIPAAVMVYSSSITINSNDPDPADAAKAVTITGEGLPTPDISVLPGMLVFPTTLVGSSSSLSVQVRNIGTAALNITGIANPAAPFTITGNDCPATLPVIPPPAFCTITITFTPTSGGIQSSSFAISSNDPVTPSVPVNLSGMGSVVPNILVSPSPLAFGGKLTGTTNTLNITVNNTGTAPLSISSVTGPAAPFSITANACSGVSLNPAVSCQITIRFIPTAAIVYNSSITINSNDPDTPAQAVTINGEGLPAPNIAGNPGSINFGAIAVSSTSAPSTITVSNIGTDTLNITGIINPTGDFHVTGTTCGGSLSVPPAIPNQCTITVVFTPTAAGFVQSTLVINSNDPDTPVLTIYLSGTGTLSPDIDVSPTTVGFGSVAVMASVESTITVMNVGTGSLTIASVSVPAAPFSISSNTCTGASLGPSASCQVKVKFSPTAAGSYSSSIVITSNDADETTVTVNLSGTGAAGPNILVSPLSFNFGSVRTGTISAPQTLTVTNTGGTNLVLTSITYPRLPYRVTADTCTGMTLGASASCTLTIVFNPTSTGYFYPYYMYISSTDPDTPRIAVILSGVGIR
ncbi:MAG: choice-of-anchor D domain-containing protein [Thermodesulfovibrionales bacterium]